MPTPTDGKPDEAKTGIEATTPPKLPQVNKTRPCASIFTPTYNTKPAYLRRLLASLYSQAGYALTSIPVDNAIEWVIVDDGSTDADTMDMLDRLRGVDGVQVHLRTHSGYIGDVKRAAMLGCTGEYLIEVDHDDVILPDCVAEVVAAFEAHATVGMVWSNASTPNVIDTFDGDKVTTKITGFPVYNNAAYTPRKTVIDGVEHSYYAHANTLGFIGMLPLPATHYWTILPNHVRAYRSAMLSGEAGADAVGYPDETLEFADDYDMWLRIIKSNWLIQHIDKVLYVQYLHGGNTWIGDAERNARLQIAMQAVQDKHYPELRLNIGCGAVSMRGFTGVDIQDHGHNIVADVANGGLDIFGTGTVKYVVTNDFIEHVQDKQQLLEDIWRIMVVGGSWVISVPSTDGRGAFQDPTHVSFWNINSFKSMYMEGVYRYGRRYKFKVHTLFDTAKNKDGVVWTRVRLIKAESDWEEDQLPLFE